MGEKMWAVFSLLMNSEECISAEEIQRQLEEKGYDIVMWTPSQGH